MTQASTALPRREGQDIRIPVVVMGPAGERGEGSALLRPVDAEYRRWDLYLRSSATISTPTTEE